MAKKIWTLDSWSTAWMLPNWTTLKMVVRDVLAKDPSGATQDLTPLLLYVAVPEHELQLPQQICRFTPFDDPYPCHY